MMTHDSSKAIVELINRLTAEPADVVSILCVDPDAASDRRRAVVCCGAWTAWCGEYYHGHDLLTALQAAEIDRKKKKGLNHEPDDQTAPNSVVVPIRRS